MKKKILYASIFISPIILAFLTLFIGRYPVPIRDMPRIFAYPFLKHSGEIDDTYYAIIWSIRMPRAILAALAGASLAVSGAAFQGLFHNPLVNSGMLGKWVAIITEMLFCFIKSTTVSSTINSFLKSKCEVGSSIIIISGCCARALATITN
jgi:ABC-type Fe3+-siderophore transport system permease subunit